MYLNARARRFVLLALAVICVTWTVGMPALASQLYPTKQQQPRGATKYLFYCHVL